MKPQVIMIPTQRPERCIECPLLGKRPASEVPAGCKYTYKCLLPGHEKFVSGRGSKQPHARFRCKEKEWRRAVVENSGDIQLSQETVDRYQLLQMDFIFEIRERRAGR